MTPPPTYIIDQQCEHLKDDIRCQHRHLEYHGPSVTIFCGVNDARNLRSHKAESHLHIVAVGAFGRNHRGGNFSTRNHEDAKKKLLSSFELGNG